MFALYKQFAKQLQECVSLSLMLDLPFNLDISSFVSCCYNK